MLSNQQNQIKNACSTFPKLRTFIQIKNFSQTSPCLTLPLTFPLRSVMTTTRLGCLPLRLETGRYSRPRLPPEERICVVCENQNKNIECIFHLIFQCQLYQMERQLWVEKVILPSNFYILSKEEQLSEVLSNPSNIKQTAKFIVICLDKRSKMMIKTKSDIQLFHTDPPENCLLCNNIYVEE